MTENAAENKWMFDFDINDESKLKEFVRDIKDLNVVSHIETHRTAHGFSFFAQREALGKPVDYMYP